MRARAADLHATRIVFLGVTGTGKTTAAEQLSLATGIPAHCVDDEIGWLPGWTHRPTAEQRAIADRLTKGEAWILDAMWSAWDDLVLERAQLIIALDYPRHVSLTRLVRRTLSRIVTKRPTCNGNVETWRGLLSSDSILLWHYRTFEARKDRIATLVSDRDAPPVLRITHPAGLDNLIELARRNAQASRTR